MIKQRGITLVELTVSLIVIGIVIFMGISFTSQMGDIIKRQEIQLQESAWESVLDNVQRGYMKSLAETNGIITSPAMVKLTLTHAAVGACGTTTNEAAVKSLLQNFAGDAEAQDLDFNPWGGRWCLRVSERITVSLSGIAVAVRPLAALSAGKNVFFNTTTSVIIGMNCPDSADNDSRHICSSGVAAAAAALKNTQEKMAVIAEKLQAYSRAQAILTPQGGFVDYFLSTAVVNKTNGCPGDLDSDPAYDINSGGPFGSTAKDNNAPSLGMKISEIIKDTNFPKFEETLGITGTDAIDGFGGDIYLDNSSCAARHPYYPAANTPPFSIRIISVLPGGNELLRIVFSDF